MPLCPVSFPFLKSFDAVMLCLGVLALVEVLAKQEYSSRKMYSHSMFEGRAGIKHALCNPESSERAREVFAVGVQACVVGAEFVHTRTW